MLDSPVLDKSIVSSTTLFMQVVQLFMQVIMCASNLWKICQDFEPMSNEDVDIGGSLVASQGHGRQLNHHGLDCSADATAANHEYPAN